MNSIVIGSGFGGIAAALRLRAKGHEVTIIEKHPDLGGRARVFKKDGFVFDGYPRYMQQVKDMNNKGIVINNIVYLNVSEEEVIRRLTARGRADDKPEN